MKPDNPIGYIIANIAPTGSRCVHTTICPKIKWAYKQNRQITPVVITDNILTWYKMCKACIKLSEPITY